MQNRTGRIVSSMEDLDRFGKNPSDRIKKPVKCQEKRNPKYFCSTLTAGLV